MGKLINLFKINDGYKRQLFKWRMEVDNNKDLKNLCNMNNGKNDVYCTVLQYNQLKPDTKKTFINPLIDKIFFDIDGGLVDKEKLRKEFKDDKKGYKKEVKRQDLKNKIKAYKEMLLFHNYFRKKRIMHVVLFSGGGFHIYVFCNPKHYIYPSSVIANYQIHVENNVYKNLSDKQLKWFYGLDNTIIGDYSRHGRKDRTLNPKRNRYCIFLTSETINKGYKWIYNYAKLPVKDCEVFGNKKVNLDNFDIERRIKRFCRKTKGKEDINEELFGYASLDNVNLNDRNTFIDDEMVAILYSLPPCLMFIFDVEPAHEIRWQFVQWLKHMGYNKYETFELCKSLNWIDFEKDKTWYQIETIYFKEKELKSCWQLKNMGWCIEGCGGITDVDFSIKFIEEKIKKI